MRRYAVQPASIFSLQNSFDALINSYIDNNVGIADDFLSVALAGHLKDNLNTLSAENKLQHAGTGNEMFAVQDKLMRSDMICWLDRSHNNAFENAFFDIMDAFVLHLNNTCYTGISGYEFHYTLYNAGTFYKKHIDQFRNNDSRQFSMIIYLNENRTAGDGGELCIHHSGNMQYITPDNCKAVFFKSSELAHEVLCTNVPRLSITGWLKR